MVLHLSSSVQIHHENCGRVSVKLIHERCSDEQMTSNYKKTRFAKFDQNSAAGGTVRNPVFFNASTPLCNTHTLE
jgi:hypothetical protein